MNASLVTIPLAFVVALLLGKVAWPRARTAVGRTRVAVGLFVLTAALLLSSLFAFFESERADSWVLAPEARTAAAVRAAPEGKTLTIMGRVSGQNPILSRNWAAFTECEGSCEEHYPDALLVDVEDGVVKVDDDSFLAIDWPSVNWGGHTTTYLEQSWPVLVVGDAEGDQQPTIEDASIVYAGPLPKFRQYAQTQHRLAFAALVLDLTLAGVMLVLALVALVRRNTDLPAAAIASSSTSSPGANPGGANPT